MDVKKKLVELIGKVQDEGVDYAECFGDGDRPAYVKNDVLADHLIASGVTVQETTHLVCTGNDEYYGPFGICHNCETDNICGSKYEAVEIRTHGDRIRAMSDEELADAWIRDNTICDRCAYRDEYECNEFVTNEKCREGILEWHKQPVKEAKTDD